MSKITEAVKRYDIAIVFPQWYPFLESVIEGVLEIRGLRQHCRFRNFIYTDVDEAIDFSNGYKPDGILASYDDDAKGLLKLNDLNIPMCKHFYSFRPEGAHGGDLF